MATLFKRFMQTRRELGCPPASQAWLETAYHRFQAFRGRRQVTEPLCRQYLSHLRQSGLPAAEVRGLWRGLRVYLRWLVEQGRLDEAVLLPGPPSQITYRDALTVEQVGQVVRMAPDQRTALLVWTFWATGLRSEKLRGLRWEDLDFQQQVLWTRDMSGQRVEVALLADLGERLRDWKRTSTSPWVFGLGKEPLTATEVRHLIRRAGESASLPFLAPGQLQYAWLRAYFRAGGLRSSGELQARLAQPFRIRGFEIPNLVTRDELRRAHAQYSPLEAALRPQKPSRSLKRRKP